MQRGIFGILLVAWSVLAWGDTFEGRVLGVLEADLLDTRDPGGQRQRIHLLGANAPEKGQKHYWDALRFVEKKLRKQKIQVDRIPAQICPPKGGHCAQLARVFVKGEDLGLLLVSRGLAWHDTRHMQEQSTTDKTLYQEAARRARRKRLGIFQSRNPTPPWEFGQKKKKPAKKEIAKRPTKKKKK